MKKKNPNLLLVLFALLTACTFDAELLPKEYPMIETLQPKPDYNGVLFKGAVTSQGTLPIIKHGFVWSTAENPDTTNHCVWQNGELSDELFSIRVSDGLTLQNYWVRAFVMTSKHTVYGKPVSFRSNHYSMPSVTDYNPKSGYPGDTLVIEGGNMNLDDVPKSAYLGTTALQIVSMTDTKWYVRIPAVNLTGKYQLTVNIGHESIHPTDSILIRSPWYKHLDYNQILHGAASFSIASKGYFINRNSYTLHIFNASNAQWTFSTLPVKSGGLYEPILGDTTTPFRTDQSKLLGFSGGSVAYVFLNGDFWEYNGTTQNWRRLAAFPGVLEDQKKNVFGWFINGKLYLGNCGDIRSFWEYNPNLNQWTSKLDLPFTESTGQVAGNVAFILDGKGYLGVTHVTGPCILRQYDPINNAWTEKNSLPIGALDNLACFVSSNQVWVGLGDDSNGPNPTLLKYDAVSDRWASHRVSNLLESTTVYACFSLNNKGYMLFPELGSTYWSSHVWEFNPIKY